MALKADIAVRIDAGDLVSTLTGELTDVMSRLDGIALPAPAGDLSTVTELAGAVDLDSVAGGVGPLLGQLATAAADLPGADDLLAPITATLALVEELLAADLATELPALFERLGQEFDGARDQGFVGLLLKFADALGAAPQSAVLRSLLDRVTAAAGIDLPSGLLSLPDVFPAIANGIRGLGALMTLETLLAEAERLTAIMARQLDPAEIQQLAAALEACIRGGGQSLAAFVAGIDTDNTAEVEAAVAAIDLCAGKLRALAARAADGMGLGEATLVYLDLSRLQGDVAAAAALLREIDLAPVERAFRSVTDRIAPALDIDLESLPSFSLDALLGQIESRIGALAAEIAAFDTSLLTAPIAQGIGVVTTLPNALTGAIAQVTASVRGALESVRDAIAALPFDTIAQALRRALEPIVQALEFIGDLVDTIKAALETAVDALVDVLGDAEAAVDAFRIAVKQLFDAAADFIDGLNLDQVIGQVADNIQAFADAIAKAQMKPYFDTAVDVLDTTTGVVEKVPFDLLPDSMESEVVAAIRPIKQTDVDAVQQEIEDLLQIGPDGKFELRPEIEAALAAIQAKYDELIVEIRKFDPRALAEQLDAELSALADRIADISPNVELAPVREAIDTVRAAIAGFDLDTLLDPLREGFAEVLAVVDQYAPGQLVAPVEARIDDVRARILAATRLPEWAAALDELHARGLELIDRLDPAQIEPQIRRALDEAAASLAALPEIRLGEAFGGIVTAFLAGSGLRINPLAFNTVLDWLFGDEGSAVLTGRAASTAERIATTRAAVVAFDPAALAARLAPDLSALQAAVAGHPAGAGKTALTAALGRLDVTGQLGGLAGNRTRYLGLLAEADSSAGTLQRIGLSEVDVAVTRLRTSTGSLAPLTGLLAAVFERVGVGGLEQGIPEALRRILAVAPPERLVALVEPIFVALRGRVAALLDAVVLPLKDGIAELITLVDALDLTPLREALDAVHAQLRTEIARFDPDQLLGEAVTAFEETRQQVVDFDPLADIEEALTALRDTVTRVLDKLDASALLERPIEVYEDLLDAFAALDIGTLLTPVLDQLDEIARQVDEGLDDTVGAFKRLQDALPSQVGSTSISASVSVG